MKGRESEILLLVFFGTDLLNCVRFPRYSYDSSSSTLTFQAWLGPIQATLVSTLYYGFFLAIGSLPPSIQDRVSIATITKYEEFQGIYTWSERVPELGLNVYSDMRSEEVKFVAEVAFLETYEELVQNAKLWLEGNKTVSLVMLVKLEEDPCYRRPIQDLTESEFGELEFPPWDEIRNQPFALSGPYGPAEYKGFKWVGKVSGFFEFWAPDPVTRLASRITTRMVSNPLRNVSYPSLPM